MKRLPNVLLARLALFLPGGYSLRPTLHRLRGVTIGAGVWISQGIYLDELYPEGIRIGDHCTLGMRTSVFTHFHWGPRKAKGGYKPVVIGDNVFIGPHCVILPGVSIGEGAVIKAGSVVSSNVPPRVFWGTPNGRPLAKVTVPLGPDAGFEGFVRGLRAFPPRARDNCPPFGRKECPESDSPPDRGSLPS